MKLLEKTRAINYLLQKSGSHPVSFSEMAETLKNVIGAHVFILSAKGKILGSSMLEGPRNEETNSILEASRFPYTYTESLLRIRETVPNVELNGELSLFTKKTRKNLSEGWTTVVPIAAGGTRVGSLVMARPKERFEEGDFILAEYGSAVVGLEITRGKAEQAEEQARNQAVVHLALNSLSYSEMEAAGSVFDELSGKEGLLVASKVADRAGITRSVIVNTLRKLEGAGVIESRSLGMKGTHIRVLNDEFIPELNKLKNAK